MKLRKYTTVLIVLFLCHLFFRFYNLEKWAVFGWDQVDNAWASAKILIAHKYPLLGMVAKQNSGMYIGPLYYYLVALFYYFTNLHPIAAPILAATTSMLSFWVIFFVAKNIFSTRIALMSCFIYLTSNFIIVYERIAWPVNFIAPLALLIFYFLYRVLTGEFKYYVHLGLATGLFFHIHFTAVYYPITILLCLPFLPKKKQALLYAGKGLLLAVFCFIPQLIYYLFAKNSQNLSHYNEYISANYHGIHARRILQLSHDAFIKFQSILETPYTSLRNSVFFFIPAFYLVYRQTHKVKLFYLIGLWILVPWIIFSTYRGEISDYYFSSHLYLAVLLFAYLSVWIWDRKILAAKIFITCFWLYFAYANTQAFFRTQEGSLAKNMAIAQQAVDQKKYLNFTEGDPQSYFYFYLMYTQKHEMAYDL